MAAKVGVPASRGMNVCARCGVIAPSSAARCEGCGAAPLVSRHVDDRADRAFWVRCRAEILCRSCGQRSPLATLDLDGTVTCLSCGFVQAFDVDVWSEALPLAHGLGDLAWPKPDGRFPTADTPAGVRNPFDRVGTAETVHRFESTGLTTSGGVMRTRSLSLELAPGSPLCETCHGPLDAVASGPGALVSCATCRTQRTYRLPQASAPVEGMPAVVLADDLCTDGAEARTDVGAGGVVALRCPTSNAALQSTAEQSLVACPFCRTLCRIPSKTLAALHPSAHVRRPFWLLFTGPSRLRRTLVEAARHDAAAREKVAAEQRLAEESRIELEEPPILVDPPEHKLLRSALVLFVLLVVGGVFFAGRIGAILSAAP